MNLIRREVLKALAAVPLVGMVPNTAAALPSGNWLRFSQATWIRYGFWQHQGTPIQTGDYFWTVPFDCEWYAMLGTSDDDMRVVVGAVRIGDEQYLELGPTFEELSDMDSEAVLSLLKAKRQYCNLVVSLEKSFPADRNWAPIQTLQLPHFSA